MYTNDKTTLILLSLLKKYNIKNIVVSPGTRNSAFAYSLQQDDFFKIYSIIDERSAAYFATGLAYETNEPVVITCTGATASRNYLPALTEAFYRKLPVIALTCGHEGTNLHTLTPQYVDRSISQNDIKIYSVTLPNASAKENEKECELLCNVALSKATSKKCGPVHINLLSLSFNFTAQELPSVNKIDSYDMLDLYNQDTVSQLSQRLSNKKVGIFIGSHKKMSESLKTAIENFVDKYNVTVFADHTSNYHGKNKILIGQSIDVSKLRIAPDILVDIGGICGQYSIGSLFKNNEVWRISEDGEIKQRHKKTDLFFDCFEEIFFSILANASDKTSSHNYYNEIKKALIPFKTDNLPLSGAFVADNLSKRIPHNSALSLSILNSLRNMNFFTLDNSVNSICNVGGFGIDGAVSTLVGQSMTDKNKLYFGQVGDLAFFYDMNALGIRHITNNLRICLINNNVGVEFLLAGRFGKHADDFIAAKGHNGSAEGWAKSVGFHYISAKSKEEFLSQIDDFCSPDINHFDKPVLFEIFVNPDDDVSAYREIYSSKFIKTPLYIKAVSCLIPDKRARRRFKNKYSK